MCTDLLPFAWRMRRARRSPNKAFLRDLRLPVLCEQAAEMWPPEAGRGQWPPDYTLSDHALVSVTFAFV